jgi:membrane protein YdbS with pleckstrin-like domain
MEKASEMVIFFGLLWIFAVGIAVFGYFFGEDKDALAGAFLMMAVMSAVLWSKAKKANL